MKSILVMGGTTFVSSAMAKYLIGKGYEVDILTRGLKEPEFSGFREHLICDRKLKHDMLEILKGKEYDFIFDISAYTKEDVEVLFTSIDKSKLKKYIFCSSGAVYKPSNTLISEDYETRENPYFGKYGTDKKEAEDFIMESGVNYAIFRPTYIYGEGNNLYREAYFFHRIRNNDVIPIPFGNNTRTQFIHIDDLVRVFESAIFNDSSSKAYNVTKAEIVSWDDLIRTCGKVVGKEPIIKEIDINQVKVDPREYFPFRDVSYILNINQLIEDELYVPVISLEEGLRKAYGWWLSEKPEFNGIKMINKADELAAYEDK